MKGLRPGAPFVCVVLGCLLTLLLQRNSFHGQFDEGYTLNAAWQMWNGMRMYDDFRLFVGPAGGYLITWAWRLLGEPSYLAARVLALLFSFSSIAAVSLILTRRGIRGATLALAIAAWVIACAQYVPINHNSMSGLRGVVDAARLAVGPGARPARHGGKAASTTSSSAPWGARCCCSSRPRACC